MFAIEFIIMFFNINLYVLFEQGMQMFFEIQNSSLFLKLLHMLNE